MSPADESAADIFGRAFQVRMKERLLRDPVHGLIAIDEGSARGRLLVRLVDSREMQRLRRVRQLGLAAVAFQGAEHSRFTHSMGAFHLLRQVVDQLGRMYTIDEELGFYASVAALLHDLGHGPFSHVFEKFSGVSHENWTRAILHDSGTEVHAALAAYSRSLPSVIESLLAGTAKPGYLCSLVSSQLDVDRLDFLLRDSLMTGVKYGVYDLDRLIHMLRISPEGERLIIADGGLVPVEKYVQARYHMYRQVYLHKTVVAAEAMLKALLRRAAGLLAQGNAAGLEPASPLARFLRDPAAMPLADYLELDDYEIMAAVKRWARAGEDPILRELSSRLLARRLFKAVEVDPSAPGFEAASARARAAVAAAGLDPEYYFLRMDSSDAPYRPYDPSSGKLSDLILIEKPGGGIADVADLSPTLRAFTHSAYTLSRIVFPSEAAGRNLRAEVAASFA